MGPHGSRASEIPNLSAWACLHAAGLRAAGHLGFARGVKSESWTSASGRLRGGKPFSRGALYLILQNRTYLGEIVHKGQSHPGEHTPIIDQPLWDAVQAQLSSNTTERSSCTRPRQPSLLTGLLFDRDGNPMTPTHAVKNGTRYRYYVSRPLITKGQSESSTGLRILAEGIERLVISRVRQWLLDPGSIDQATRLSDASAQRRLVVRAAEIGKSWPELPAARQRAFLTTLIERIDVGADRIDIHFRPTWLGAFFDVAAMRSPSASDAIAGGCAGTPECRGDPRRDGFLTVDALLPRRIGAGHLRMGSALRKGATKSHLDAGIVTGNVA